MNPYYPSIELASAPADEAPPVMGEQTTAQAMSLGAASIAGGVVTSFADALGGFGRPPAPTPHTYRLMRNNADVAIARMTIHAPIKAANWMVETNDDAPSGAEELIADLLDHKTSLLDHALRMLDYGRSSFETVWEDQAGAIVPGKFKPLLVDITAVNVDRDTGAYAGLKNGRTALVPANTLHFTFDGEAGDYYGRSLFENIRQYAWWPWLQTLRRSGQFSQKVAGSRLVIHYVPGQGRDKNGAVKDNFDAASEIATLFSRGEAVLVPIQMVPWAEDMMRQGADPAKLLTWQFSYLEPATGHATEFLDSARSYQAAILRGLMVPERVVTEGKFGTKAESEAQATIAIAFSEEVSHAILDYINWYVVNRVMRINYGEEAVGTVWIAAESLIDEKRALIREVVRGVLTAPGNTDIVQIETDLRGMFEQVGVPLSPDAAKPGGDVLEDMRVKMLERVNGNGDVE